MLAERRPDVGFMTTYRIRRLFPDWMPVAYDNHRFVGHQWRADAWRRWLARQRRGLFAVVPDVVCDARATRIWFERYAPFVRSCGQPLAYATQNGSDRYPPPWDDFDVLFIGGDNAFKLGETAWGLCREAAERRKPVHVGRVNSLRRLRACRTAAVTTTDGTFLRRAVDANWPRLCRYLDRVNSQPALQEAP